MRSALLALLLQLPLASSAAAQISVGPSGPFALVDDNGKLVGGVLGAFPNVGGDAYVSLTTPQGSGSVRLHNEGVGALEFELKGILFTTSDCSGQAYVQMDGFPPGINGGPSLEIGWNSILYASSGPPVASVSMASLLDTDIGCQPTSQTLDVVPFIEVGDLGAEFTPPFRVVTAASQMAALPIEIGWLVGGVLLGLGLKNTVKRRRV